MAISKIFVYRMWQKLCIILLSIIFTVFVFLTFLFVFVPIYIFRYLVTKLAPWVRPDLVKILSIRSTAAAIDDLTGVPTYTLLTAITVEENVDIEFVREEMMNKFIYCTKKCPTPTPPKNDTSDDCVHSKIPPRENLKYPEFQQYFETFCDFTFWKWDEEFCIKNHVTSWSQSETESVNEIDVAKLRLALVRKPYEQKRGLWEIIIVNNFVPTTEPNKENKRAVILFRLHHSLLDGYALLKLFLTQMMEKGISHQALPVPKPYYPKRNWCASFRSHLYGTILTPHTIVKNHFECVEKNIFQLSEKELTRKIFPASDRVSMNLIHEVRKANGDTSFTAVILAMLCGGIRNFLVGNEMKIPEFIRIVMPLPWPNHPDKLRNYWTFGILKLPMSAMSSLERLQSCQENWKKMKMSTRPAINFALVPMLGSLNNRMIKLFVPNKSTTLVLSNFPGPPANSHFFGHHVLDASFGGGLGRGSLGFGVALLSYGPFLRINIGIDQGILPSQSKVQELMNFITKELGHLQQQSMV